MAVFTYTEGDDPVAEGLEEGNRDAPAEDELEPEDEGSEELDDSEDDEGSDPADDGDEDDGAGLILGKFKDQAALEAAYTALQKRLGKQGAPKEEESNSLRLNAPPPKDSPAPKAGDAKAPVDFSAVEADFIENGSISEETYTALDASGVPRNVADRYIRGLQADAQAVRSSVAEVVGGEENISKVLKWAKGNLSVAERNYFDQSLSDPDAARMAMAGVFARYSKVNGKESKTVGGATTRGASGAKPFASVTEYADAINDPKYDKDASFRKQVDARLIASKF